MKHFICVVLSAVSTMNLHAQENYPVPEFSNEVYILKKDSLPVLQRLEKTRARMDNKAKAGGFGGFESGYTIEGDRSSTRLKTGEGFTFVFTDDRADAGDPAVRDSIMRANGVDPSLMSGMRMDPSNMITLYKTE